MNFRNPCENCTRGLRKLNFAGVAIATLAKMLEGCEMHQFPTKMKTKSLGIDESKNSFDFQSIFLSILEDKS